MLLERETIERGTCSNSTRVHCVKMLGIGSGPKNSILFTLHTTRFTKHILDGQNGTYVIRQTGADIAPLDEPLLAGVLDHTSPRRAARTSMSISVPRISMSLCLRASSVRPRPRSTWLAGIL